MAPVTERESVQKTTPMILLDDQGPGSTRESLLFQNPDSIVSVQRVEGIHPALASLDAARSKGKWIAGWLAYEAAAAFEPRLAHIAKTKAPEPLLWFGIFDAPKVLNPDAVGDFLTKSSGIPQPGTGLDSRASGIGQSEYYAAIERILNYLAAGDAYQINHTFDLMFEYGGDPRHLYACLRQTQPVEFGAYIETGEHFLLSRSPELFIRKTGSRIETRPMKGTAPRGQTLFEDQQQCRALAADQKSQAENLMIVDLLRNDLSRIADPGSVSVTKLFEIERYQTLLQMTSTVEANRSAPITLSQVFGALFPCGSVTGAPKIRAMEIIHELEGRPRGVYTGAIGYAGPTGGEAGNDRFCFNVPIRTMVMDQQGRARMGIGAGIVADSNPETEYDECLLKARFLETGPDTFDLIETLGWSKATGFKRLDRHLTRLQKSAEQFGFVYKDAQVRDALKAAIRHMSNSDSAPGTIRVRVLLAASGHATATASETVCEVTDPEIAKPVVLCPHPYPRSDPLLRHKTTRRQAYDAALSTVRESNPECLDVLFINEKGELAEGSYTNVFVERDGALVTPPLQCGLLPGVLRAELIDTGKVSEAVLALADLRETDRIFIGNSLRGLMPAFLTEPD